MVRLIAVSLVCVAVIAGCDDDTSVPASAPVEDTGGFVPAPAQQEPDYPSCVIASEGELCIGNFGKVEVKPVPPPEPEFPSCVIAQVGEVCQESFGKVIVKIQPCYSAISGEVCEQYGSTIVKP